MVPTNGYVDTVVLAAYMKDPEYNDDDQTAYASAIDAASRRVDGHCRTRFYADTVATARVFVPPCHPVRFLIDDFHTTDGLVVKTDDDGDGVYETTWTIGTDFRVAPWNQIHPTTGETCAYNELVPTGTRAFPRIGGLPTVQATAKWGWPAVVPSVSTLTKILVAAYDELRGGPKVVTQDELDRAYADVAPYRRTDRVGLA